MRGGGAISLLAVTEFPDSATQKVYQDQHEGWLAVVQKGICRRKLGFYQDIWQPGAETEISWIRLIIKQ